MSAACDASASSQTRLKESLRPTTKIDPTPPPGPWEGASGGGVERVVVTAEVAGLWPVFRIAFRAGSGGRQPPVVGSWGREPPE